MQPRCTLTEHDVTARCTVVDVTPGPGLVEVIAYALDDNDAIGSALGNVRSVEVIVTLDSDDAPVGVAVGDVIVIRARLAA